MRCKMTVLTLREMWFAQSRSVRLNIAQGAVVLMKARNIDVPQ